MKRLMILFGLLFVVMMGGGILWHGSAVAHAAGECRQGEVCVEAHVDVTCAQELSMMHCEYTDPETQGCAVDAQTTGVATFLLDGKTVGRLERRYSPWCQTSWGRLWDYRGEGGARLRIANEVEGGVSWNEEDGSRGVYSVMVTVERHGFLIGVEGWLWSDDGREIKASIPQGE
ncbi:uncharacterized protein DUF2690 [Thermosporothrix hazakensis]|uniref:Uncharacterized protein DUF2690 n=1 Tax=Thermosporothrix hazakensis TaxID=644383 RepID=A0A326TSE2_THEHA|nr:DUF2690 domain-containing protein [Thermosporothrix hazakensis]PZW18104.1 uncharacterized protein DUF2690 [Thermosporothrix hazakensis]GCE50608.1 hypothetical protein KTH_54770 [Thermosporothrix hazakensis]